MDVDEKLTECEKYRNLCWFRKLLEEIDENEPGVTRPAEELIDELVEFFHDIRIVIPNFKNIHNPHNSPSVEEHKTKAEEMAQLFENDAPWEDADTISVFKQFLIAVDGIVQGTCDFEEMEVDNLLSDLTIPQPIK
jgi:hypothetical protein